MATSKVYPCYKNQFKVGASGSTTPSTSIANCEEFSVSIDNGVQDWNAFEQEGWTSRLMTSKSVSISVKAKYTPSDAGQKMIIAVAFENGTDTQLNFLWTFPNGASVLFEDAVVSVSALGSGGSTDVAPLEFEIQSNGKPTYTAAA